MKKTGAILLVFVMTILLSAQNREEIYRAYGYNFISPLPGSSLLNPGNNIIVRYKSQLVRQKIQDNFITVTGSKSGNHEGRLILSDDNRTLVFNPYLPFELGETVSVKLNKGSFCKDWTELREFSFQFKISEDNSNKKNYSVEELMGNIKPINNSLKESSDLNRTYININDSLPNGYPSLKITVSDNSADGYFFLSPFNYPSAKNNYLTIISNTGVPIFYRKMNSRCYDFKVQSTGSLTYFDEDAQNFYEMNSSYSIVDSFACGNGYNTDLHDLLILPNGHALLFSIDSERIRMDTIVTGGDSSAAVLGAVIQELDKNKNVVFQWRSWDHYKITDAMSDINLTAKRIDYVHGNAIELDNDGNLLFSARHMDEITKINRETGDIIWRLGGKNNEFTFMNDKYQFSHQHDVRCWPDGNISLFDNGNLHSPRFTRAVVYQLNDSAKTATLVWEYRHNPDFFSPAMGSNRMLPNGDRIIGWGIKGKNSPDISEVTEDGKVSFEAYLQDTIYSYRAFKFKWKTGLFTASSYNVGFGKVLAGDSASLAIMIRNNSQNEISITSFYNRDKVFSVENKVPFSIKPGKEIPISIKYKADSSSLNPVSDTLYVFSEKPGERIAQVIFLTAQTIVSVDNTDIQPLNFNLSQNYPNPFNPSTTIEYSIPQKSNVLLVIYDLLGRKVAELVNEEETAGKYKTKFDGSKFSSGIYFYKLTASSINNGTSIYSQVKKFILLK